MLDEADPPSPQSLTNAIGAVTDDVDNLLRERPDVNHPDLLQLTGDEAWHLAIVERGQPPDASVVRLPLVRDDVEDLFRTLATERRTDRLHNPALHAERVDSILAACCAVLAIMRKLQFATGHRHPPRERRAPTLMRHPSGRPTIPSPLRLYGSRVMLRPLVAQDFSAWREVRQRNEGWLTPWEPRRPLPQFDPTINRDAFVSRCAARERDAASGNSFGFGLFVDDRLCGEINVNHVLRGALQAGTIGYWIDERSAGRGLVAEGVVVVFEFAFERLWLHRLEINVVPRNANSRRVMEKLDIRTEGIAVRMLEINGVWEDHVRYAITAEEWQERADGLSPALAAQRSQCFPLTDVRGGRRLFSEAEGLGSRLAHLRAPLPHLQLPVSASA